METLQKFMPVIIAIVIIAVIIGVVSSVLKKIRRTVRSIKSTISDVSNIASTVKMMASEMDDIVEPKSIGGSTSMYLKMIEKDFPDYHNPDAENAIRTFLTEYTNIRHGSQNEFKTSKVNDKVLINVNKGTSGRISNLIFNKIAIYDYKKTREYATVTYRCSLGYDLNGKRIETRYEVDYTLQLLDNETATVATKCPNCGGTYSTTDNCCPYCGAGIIKDTLLTWFITKANEI